ncbi:hypothetical protein QYM36_000061 [Artemia franciscana]|uniref:Rab-GAP TBC domain-containing protein n=1 Tax=Artemia franciscana TaxID=6661 RepID=A0AA88IKH7_ARTSF|nr:hypothetical protein QYM36_000061 [Artemia franciscana]
MLCSPVCQVIDVVESSDKMVNDVADEELEDAITGLDAVERRIKRIQNDLSARFSREVIGLDGEGLQDVPEVKSSPSGSEKNGEIGRRLSQTEDELSELPGSFSSGTVPRRKKLGSLNDDDSDDATSVGSGESTFSRTDRYGFLGGSQYALWDDPISAAVSRRRERKWVSMLKRWDYYRKNKFSKVILRCRKGVPTSIRGKAWQHLCGAHELIEKNPGVFEDLLKQPGDQRVLDEITRDLHRQFPLHEMFEDKNGPGQQELFKILKAYSILKPYEGYCQSQGPIASVLLMQMPSEAAFWCLVAICEFYVPGYYAPGLEQFHVDCNVLMAFLKKTAPVVHKHLVIIYLDRSSNLDANLLTSMDKDTKKSSPAAAAKVNPYIGSKISILSKSKMRYEGVLYQLDQDQSTLALAKVRSFGTEDRVPEKPVAPREEIFDYIVFRAVDIKDIKLCEPPKEPRMMPGGLAMDPAIVQYAMPDSSNASGRGENSGSIVHGIDISSIPSPIRRPQSAARSYSSMSTETGDGGATSQLKMGDLLNDFVRFGNAAPSSAKAEEKPGMNTEPSGTFPLTNDYHTRGRGGFRNRGNRQYNWNRGGSVSSRLPTNYMPPAYMMRGAFIGPTYFNNYRRPSMPFQNQYVNWNRRPYNNFRSNWNPSFGYFQRRRGQSQVRRFATEYDFERANTRFMKIKVKTIIRDNKQQPDHIVSDIDERQNPQEEPKVNGIYSEDEEINELAKTIDKMTFYSKEKSFFDKISCEGDARRERKDKAPSDYQRGPNSATYYYNRSSTTQPFRGGRGGYSGYGRGGNFGFRGGHFPAANFRRRTTISSRIMENGH